MKDAIRSALALPIPLRLYGQLSQFYGSYCAVIGLLLPFWALYLNSKGFSAWEIGIIMSVLSGSSMFAPMIWGWLGDHHMTRIHLIRLGASLCCLSFVAILSLPTSFTSMLTVMLVYSIGSQAIIPQLEALTFSWLGEHANFYSRIRLWGSIGFIASVLLGGLWFESRPITQLPMILLVVFMWVLWCSFTVPHQHKTISVTHSEGLLKLLRQPVIALFFLSCGLMQVSLHMFYSFFSLLCKTAGHSELAISWLWAFAVICEIVAFWYAPSLLKKMRPLKLMQFAMILTAVRWVIVTFHYDSIAWLFASQTFHAISYALFHAACLHKIQKWFPGKLSGRGQAFYVMVSSGFGGTVGALSGGYFWELLDTGQLFLVASSINVLGAVCISLALMINKKSSST